jgi:hypothetical protein
MSPSILFTSLIPKLEFTRWGGSFVSAPGSISIARETSRYMSPKRRRGASTFPTSITLEPAKDFLKIDRASLKESLEWKSAGK